MGENKFHPFVVWSGIHRVWLLHDNYYCTAPSWWAIIWRRVVIGVSWGFLLHACHWLVVDDYQPRLITAFNLFNFQFADSWTATISQSTTRTTEGILSVWDTTDTRDDGLRMRRTMRGVVGSLVSFLGNASPGTTRDTAPLQVAFFLLVLKEAVVCQGIGFKGCPLIVCVWLNRRPCGTFANILNLTIQWYCFWIYLQLHRQVFNPMPSTGWICLLWSWNQLFCAFYLTNVTDSLCSYIPCGKVSSIEVLLQS